MIAFLKLKLKDKGAQALPEFALCLPLIMLMIGILITMAQMVYAKEVCQAAAQSGCRTYVIEEDKTKATEYAKDIMRSAGMNIAIASGGVDFSDTGILLGGYTYVTCKTTGAITTIFPVQWNNNVINKNVTFINGYCSMVREY